MENEKRNISIFAQNVIPINFCGKTIMWQFDCRVYEPPYETMPTKGEHDFNTCEVCQKELQKLKDDFTRRFNGTKEKLGFPLCCNHHAEFAKLQIFDINDFRQVPDWTAKKIIYTKQHIENHIFTNDYYKEITDYIDYTVDSFGQMPNDSEPLYLGSYLSYVTDIISNHKGIPKEKRDKLLEYIRLFNAPKNSVKTDFNLLKCTYEKWFNIFPWNMSFFTSLKPQFETLPIIQSVLSFNKYSEKAIAKLHTKSSLIEMLEDTTNRILTQINSLDLYNRGYLTDPQRVKLELILNERRLKLQQGYVNKSPSEEQRYRNILKKWFADEKKFIDEITPLLSAPQQDNLMPISTERKIDEFLNYFSGRCSQEFRTRLIQDIDTVLLSKPNGRQITAIASVIYNSDKLCTAIKPKTFNKWLEVFSKCWNVAKPTSKPGAVSKEIADAANTFYYV